MNKTGNVEFRDGQTYDFLVTKPGILTVEVGEPNIDTPLDDTQQYMNPSELDRMLEQFSREADQVKHITLPVRTEQPAVSLGVITAPERMTLEESELMRQRLIDQLNDSYDAFLKYVQYQAQNYARVIFTTPDMEESPREKLLAILDTTTLHADEWHRKLNEIQSSVKLVESQDLEIRENFLRKLHEQRETTVASHVASALNDALDRKKVVILQDIKMLHQFQQYQNNLLRKVASSYVMFYSWMIEQWNQNIRSINDTRSKVQKRIDDLWNKEPTFRDIDELLTRYKTFLRTHEAYLPLEFTLSADSRDEWRDYMSKHQPEECIRLMKKEIQSLEVIPVLAKSIEIWKRELSRYDVSQLKKMNENRQRLKKRLEDAVQVETKETCQRKWKELTDHVYKLGAGIQQKANHALNEYSAVYKARQRILLDEKEKLQNQIDNFERQLSVMNPEWALLMESRKAKISRWVMQNYWQVSVSSLLNVNDIVSEFRRFIETHVDSKLE